MKVPDNTFPFLFSGKFGNVVGRIVNGKQIIAKSPVFKKRKPTERELEIRKNFTMVIRFLKPIAPFLKEKYSQLNSLSGFNKATSHNLRNAIQGKHPDQRIDYSKVILGEGTLPNPKNYRVESPAKGLLEFTWSMETMKRRLAKSDRIFTVVYCEELSLWGCALNGTERREKQFLMDASRFSGQTVHVYLGFVSSTGLLVSTSIYAGSIHVL
jgi:hypothetical protein